MAEEEEEEMVEALGEEQEGEGQEEDEEERMGQGGGAEGGGGEVEKERFVSSPDKRQFDAGVAAALCRGMLKVLRNHSTQHCWGGYLIQIGYEKVTYAMVISPMISPMQQSKWPQGSFVASGVC